MWYAQIDENNIVVGVSDLSGEVKSRDMIPIEKNDVELGSEYLNGVFFPPKPVETPVSQEVTLEELQETNIAIMSAIADIFERGM